MTEPLQITGGTIRTLDPHGPEVETLQIRHGHILAAGSKAQIGSTCTSSGEEIHLPKGSVALPAFVESHAHFRALSLAANRLQLDDCQTVEDALTAVTQRTVDSPPGQWIRGRGWHPGRWGDHFPTAESLDAAAPDHPVALATHDGHVLWLNTRAMEETGALHIEDIEGGETTRDTASRPTGIFKERAAGWIQSRLPAPNPEEVRSALQAGQHQLHTLGITSLTNYEGTTDLQTFRRMELAGELTLRLTCNLEADELDAALALGLSSGLGSDQLRLGGLKIYLDGALGSQTAHLLAPYENTNHRGIEVTDRATFANLVDRAIAGGLVPTVHAIGDAACRTCLDVFEEVLRDPAERPLAFRPRIEHAQHLAPEDIPRFGSLGITASVQPSHLFADIDLIDERLGPRGVDAFPWRRLLDTGALLAFGSDAPIEQPDPLRGLWAAVTRSRTDGTPAGGWNPVEAVSMQEAFQAYTHGGALACGMGSRLGRLAPGWIADVVVLSTDPLASGDPDTILEADVLLTVAGGQIVHRREDIL